MLTVLTYDVDMTDGTGAKRLRRVAHLCERYGVRVQNSVFEVLADVAQMSVLKNELNKIIDTEKDSIRFYRLGNTYKNRIETMGKNTPIQAGEPLIF